MRTGSPIVYTSADSVFQVAAHEEVIPLWELYKICETARGLLRGPYEVGRVIARPFIGSPGSFTRTPNRKDYAVPPPRGMLLDVLEERGVAVHSVGKIFDVFLGRGIREYSKTKNNADGMAHTLEAMRTFDAGLIFVNLVDFDQQYGHRNDVEGYAAALNSSTPGCRSFFAEERDGDLAILFLGAQALAIEAVERGAHLLRQRNAFDGADLREKVAAKREPARAGQIWTKRTGKVRFAHFSSIARSGHSAQVNIYDKGSYHILMRSGKGEG